MWRIGRVSLDIAYARSSAAEPVLAGEGLWVRWPSWIAQSEGCCSRDSVRAVLASSARATTCLAHDLSDCCFHQCSS
jgi:hypothetical protein